MACKCRLYYGTGFDFENVPDRQALLHSASIYIDVPALDILQPYCLNTVRVKWPRSNRDQGLMTADGDPVGVDYVAITDESFSLDASGNPFSNPVYYYFVISPPRAVASDVYEFSISLDYFTTAGGIEGIQIVDGITERVHVSDDSYGAWTAEDGLLAPAEPLELDIEWVYTEGDDVTYKTVIESTVDPLGTYNDQRGVTYTDSASGELCTVPSITPNTDATGYQIGTHYNKVSAGTALYDVSYTNMNYAIANLRALGVEQCIIRQVQYPTGENGYVTFSVASASGRVSKVTGKQRLKTPTASFAYSPYATAKNNRLNYSQYSKFGLITSAGNSAEFDPADIYVQGTTKPKVACFSDPHPDGKPYFRFESVNGDNSVAGFWRNAIEGMQWKEVPLLFTEKSGSAIDYQKFENARNVVSTAFRNNMKGLAIQQYGINQSRNLNFLNAGVSGLGLGLAGANGKMSSSEFLNNGIGVGSQALSAGLNQAVAEASIENTINASIANLQAQGREAAYNFGVSQNIVVPTVNFPFNSEIIRDFYGNGCLIYRYKYSNNDVARIDKLLTYYGYTVTKKLELSDFTNRQHFNYVMVQSCNIISSFGATSAYKFPHWFSAGLKAQLSGGVRVWHDSFPRGDLLDNPIVGTT